MSCNGNYVLESSENLEPFLKSLGIKDEKIQKIAGLKPTTTITLTGSKLEITSKGAETVQNSITLGSPSTFTFASGFELEVNISFTGTCGKGTIKKGERTGEITLDFTDSQLIEVFNVGGNVCKRIYKKT